MLKLKLNQHSLIASNYEHLFFGFVLLLLFSIL